MVIFAMPSLGKPSTRRKVASNMAVKVHPVPSHPHLKTSAKSSKLLGLLEESAKLRQELKDIRGQFLVALDQKSRRTVSSPSRVAPMSPHADSPSLRKLTLRASQNLSPAPLRSRKIPHHRDLKDKENMKPCEEIVKSPESKANLQDLSQISDITQHISYREQPSTANLDGNLHSTFNYPLHSTLNYPLSSTINFFDEPLPQFSHGHESETDGSTLPEISLAVSKPKKGEVSKRESHSRRSSSSSSSYSVRKHMKQQKKELGSLPEVPVTLPVCSSRYVMGSDEVDVDCDSSVLSELDDLSQEETLINEDTLAADNVNPRRTLTRQTGQTALTLNPRPPLALSESDFYCDVSCMQTSTEATRGSMPDVTGVTHDVGSSAKSSRRKSSKSSCPAPPPSLVLRQHNPKADNSHKRTSNKPASKPLSLGFREPPCGEESKENAYSAIPNASRVSKRKMYTSSTSSSISSHDLSRQQKRELSKKIRHFSSSINSQNHQDSITTLGVF